MMGYLISIFLLFPILFLQANTLIESKILICGVGKNVEKGFSNVKSSATTLGSHFLDYRVIVYENNSQDKTKALYQKWAQENPKVIFLSENLSQNFIDRYVLKVGDYRTQLIARARNIVLDEARKDAYADFEYLIMADLDEFEPWDIQEILNTINHPEHTWDAVFSNGSYDTYPLRSPEFCLGPEFLNHMKWINYGNRGYGSYLRTLINKGKWIKMESAFGGLAIYKLKAILSSRYQALIDPIMIRKEIDRNLDFDILLKQKKELISLVQASKTKYLEMVKKDFWTRSDLENILSSNSSTSIYRCEHISLHQKMIENGFDRLYLNPRLKSVNKHLGNF
jgi:hypothetical protein